MKQFRESNRFLMYLVNFTGLYMRSIETLLPGRWTIAFLRMWSKVPLLLLPLYLGSAVKYLIFDEGRSEVKLSVLRRFFAFGSYYFKNLFFYFKSERIEKLIDLWDSSFADEFFDAERREHFQRNQSRFLRIVKLAFFLNLLPALIYSVPPLFSASKVLPHPTGYPYREQSPDYELMVVFDFFRVTFACCLASAFDCLLIVLLSLELAELTHLKMSLSAMMDEVAVDDRGALKFKADDDASAECGCGRDSRAFVETAAEEESALIRKERIFRRRIRIWVSHHQQSLRYFKELKDVYGPVASVQLVYVVCYTCFTAFHLIAAKPSVSDLLVLPFIASSNVVSLFWWCRIGDAIDDISSQLFAEGFDRAWFLLSARAQRTFYFIALRGRKRMGLNGLSVYPLNSVTFFEIFKVTYQLFAFIMHVYEKHE